MPSTSPTSSTRPLFQGASNSSALDAGVSLRSNGRPAGLMLYARLIADQLEATSGKIDFASVGALPAASTRSTRRTFGACSLMMARGVMRCRSSS